MEGETLEHTLVFLETPRDKEAEDYINQLRGMEQYGFQCLSFQRVCDGCHIVLHYQAKDVEFKCHRCNTRYDLCVDCQPCYPLNMCPPGYGCKRETLCSNELQVGK